MAHAKRRTGPPKIVRKLTEPIARALAGRRWFPLGAVVHHRGRRSGAEYATPVAVIPTVDPQIVLIGLPWGLETNWARNVVAAGGARLTWRGRGHRMTDPRVLEPIEAMALARRPFRLVLRVMPGALVLTRRP
jgi:deazaflavin-dependent oxidoreductase (nitroreductase family)